MDVPVGAVQGSTQCLSAPRWYCKALPETRLCFANSPAHPDHVETTHTCPLETKAKKNSGAENLNNIISVAGWESLFVYLMVTGIKQHLSAPEEGISEAYVVI